MNKRVTDLNLVFSTPLWTSVISNYKEINKKMLNYINNLRMNNPKGTYKSNILGWHSENFNLNDDEPKFFINSLGSTINELFNDMGWDLIKNESKVTGMWSIINPTNASNARHIHANNFISAVYYINAPTKCGDILFYDPRSANVIRKPITSSLNNINAQVVNITPKEGLLALFPSYIHHSVEMNNSNEERIIISFNIDLIQK